MVFHLEGALCPLITLRGGLLMIMRWQEFFSFCLVVIGIVSLVIQAYKKK